MRDRLHLHAFHRRKAARVREGWGTRHAAGQACSRHAPQWAAKVHAPQQHAKHEPRQQTDILAPSHFPFLSFSPFPSQPSQNPANSHVGRVDLAHGGVPRRVADGVILPGGRAVLRVPAGAPRCQQPDLARRERLRGRRWAGARVFRGVGVGQQE